MIECKKSEYENIVLLKCTKAKDAEPFADIEVGLEKIAFPNGRSSLVGTPPSLLNRVFKSTAPYRFVCGPTLGPLSRLEAMVVEERDLHGRVGGQWPPEQIRHSDPR